MPLTTVMLRHERQDVSAALADIQRLHSLVYEAALLGEQPQRVMWAHPERGTLLIRHHRPIDVRDFPAGWAVKATSEAEAVPERGDLVDLAWIASPQRRSKIDGKRASKGVSESELPEWAADRLAPIIDIKSLDISPIIKLRGRRADGNHPTVNQCVVRAHGTVADAELLAGRMKDGLGHGRAYGCGIIITRKASPR